MSLGEGTMPTNTWVQFQFCLRSLRSLFPFLACFLICKLLQLKDLGQAYEGDKFVLPI